MMDVKITTSSMFNLDQSVITEGKIDSTGNCFLEIFIDKPIFANLKIDEETNPVYLEPGVKLNVIYGDEDQIYFKGENSTVNNYLLKITKSQREIENRGGKNIAELNRQTFLNRLDTLERFFIRFHRDFVIENNIPHRIASLLDARNKLRILGLKQAFQWNYGARNNFDIPSEYDISKEIPYDSVLLNSGMIEYALLLHFKLNIQLRSISGGIISKEEAIKREREAPLLINNEITSGEYPEFMKQFLLAKNIDLLMSANIANPIIDTLYTEFIQQYPEFPFIGSLKDRYNKIHSLSSGYTAPVITGKSPTNRIVSSDQFIGKIVYVDVWASWCGPCLKEIPFAQKLQSEFQKNASVVFLNVSVDQDENDWKRSLERHKDWGGEHILNDRSIYKLYNISGIPRYILINKRGELVKADAPRPSSDKIEEEIIKLLAED
jgi:thiol-disulfide isomerase/thioredoxin